MSKSSHGNGRPGPLTPVYIDSELRNTRRKSGHQSVPSFYRWKLETHKVPLTCSPVLFTVRALGLRLLTPGRDSRGLGEASSVWPPGSRRALPGVGGKTKSLALFTASWQQEICVQYSSVQEWKKEASQILFFECRVSWEKKSKNYSFSFTRCAGV